MSIKLGNVILFITSFFGSKYFSIQWKIRAVHYDGESEDSVTLTAKTAQNYGKIKCSFLLYIINNRILTYAVTNGDGIDLGSSSNVQILNNLLDTGDDAFALSAGAGRIGENGKSTECILIRNNYIRHSHGAPSAGSHTAAWIKNLLVEYNVIVSASNGIRCKSSPPMGGGVKNAIFRNIAISFVNVQINNFNGNSAWKINDAQKLKFENVPTLKRNNWA
uniref:Pectate lyase n=1 Tax=Meloidogyne floridensis TaxID=298350 RepID=A0A915P7Y8_9BILA